MIHELLPLPYPNSALVPLLSAETLDYHYGKHHKAYVNKLNELIRGSKFEDLPLEQIIKESSGAIFNNASQDWNHTFFWNCLNPDKIKMPSEVSKVIEKAFGSSDSFYEQFLKMGSEHFGSGWIWLIEDVSTKAVSLITTHDGDDPLRTGKRPLLTCDLWEHAYYIDYRNERPKYIESFFKLINWNFVAENLRHEWKVAA